MSARTAELGRQPYTARDFFLKHADRILFGTDLVPPSRCTDCISVFSKPQTNISSIPPRIAARSLNIYGLHLPDDVLRKIYRKTPCVCSPCVADCAIAAYCAAGRRTCAARHSLIACSAWSNCCGVSDFRTSCAAAALCSPRPLPKSTTCRRRRDSFRCCGRVPATFRDCIAPRRRHNSPPLHSISLPRGIDRPPSPASSISPAETAHKDVRGCCRRQPAPSFLHILRNPCPSRYRAPSPNWPSRMPCSAAFLYQVKACG